MPTGYTADVQSGKITTLAEYAMICARAFSACVMMRDDPLGPEIPEFEPSTHCRDEMEKAKADLAAWQGMTETQRIEMQAREYAETVKYAEEQIAEINEQRRRYESMLAKAMAFVPPTSEHEGLARFMVDQLEDSIRFDCDTKYWDEMKRTIPFDEWQQRTTGRLLRDVEFYADEWQKEQQRTRSRNKLVRALKQAVMAE
jgi:hypothetical protein